MRRPWDRREDESSRAFDCFATYRDLGAGRSLAKTAEIVYGSGAKRGQLEKWSSHHAWVERARAWDEQRDLEKQMVRHDIEKERAIDRAQREAAIMDGILEVREEALQRAKFALKWPMVHQRVVEYDDEGRPVEIHYYPSDKWSLSTVRSLFEIIVHDLEGGGAAAEAPVGEIDYSGFSDEELEVLVRMGEKVRFLRPGETPAGLPGARGKSLLDADGDEYVMDPQAPPPKNSRIIEDKQGNPRLISDDEGDERPPR